MKGMNGMKRLSALLTALILVIGGSALTIKLAKAQTLGPPISIESTSPHTACVISATGATRYCFASDGLYVSLAGAAYVQLTGGAPAGVVSFNGRTGAVVSVPGDYSYSQLANPPTTVTVPSTGWVIK